MVYPEDRAESLLSRSVIGADAPSTIRILKAMIDFLCFLQTIFIEEAKQINKKIIEMDGKSKMEEVLNRSTNLNFLISGP